MYPRAVNPDGSLKSAENWVLGQTFVGRGAALGANATIVCGITIGQWAMVGAGSVVTRSVPDFGLVLGNPARLRGFVCRCGARLALPPAEQLGPADDIEVTCPKCQDTVVIARQDYEHLDKEHR